MPKIANIGFLIFLVIVAMDIVAGILGIEAQKAQNKVKVKHHDYKRQWPVDELKGGSHEHDAFKLGLGAVVLLALAHVAANLLAGCTCICSSAEVLERSSPNRKTFFACLIFSWFTVAIGLPMLIIGTLANSKSRDSVGMLHLHLLSIGGILCFVHVIFCIPYYFSATATIPK